ncbi:Activin receptor type-1 [Blomia tropicalis]|nr:Activin receptor type-1 [Blomia tropicalis]
MVRCYQCEYESCEEELFQECITNHFCFTSTTLEHNDGIDMIAQKRGCEDMGLVCHFRNITRHEVLNSKLQMDCCNTDYCNGNHVPFPQLPIQLGYDNLWNTVFIISFSTISILILYISYLLYKRINGGKLFPKREQSYQNNANHVEREYLNSDYKPEVKVTLPGESTLGVIDDGTVTSGSGSGYPLLVQRTLAKQITLISCIGQGRYGEVWKGLFHYDEVAVKIFYSRDEASWHREIEIYSTMIVKNENILPFIGSDVTSVNSCTQLWLVTTYYPLGSLFDYLNMNTLTIETMYSVMISIVSGVCHLHTEVFGTHGKPAIAHRDIKSKNILMKTDRTCCIADFGLAVTHKQTLLNVALNHRVGTKRYMAPEVLKLALQENNFQSYMMADLYSLSLVLWEIVRRTESKHYPAFNYMVPYQGMVASDPSFDDMRRLVCDDNRRPEIPKEIETHLPKLSNIIKETWSGNPKTRLPALRIKKSLINIWKDTFETMA